VVTVSGAVVEVSRGYSRRDGWSISVWLLKILPIWVWVYRIIVSSFSFGMYEARRAYDVFFTSSDISGPYCVVSQPFISITALRGCGYTAELEPG
jgi:hypothetical protein